MIWHYEIGRVAAYVASLVVLALTLGACDELLLDEQTITVTASGTLEGLAYFDADGNMQQDAADPPYPNLALELVTVGGGTVATMITDDDGRFLLEPVPAGAYRVVVDEANAPDTVTVFGLEESAPIEVTNGGMQQVVIRIAFPTVSLAAVRASPPGRHVITHGIALNPRNSFGDGVVHIQENDVYVRATAVDRSGLAPGDSVRFIGTTAIDQGQPILTQVTPLVLIGQATLVSPITLSTSAAAGAAGATSDAAFVRVQNAAVTNRVPLGNHTLVTVDDGSGPVDLLLRDFIGFDTAPFEPGVAVLEEGLGLLVPIQVGQGQTRWRMTPRFPGDLTLGGP